MNRLVQTGLAIVTVGGAGVFTVLVFAAAIIALPILALVSLLAAGVLALWEGLRLVWRGGCGLYRRVRPQAGGTGCR